MSVAMSGLLGTGLTMRPIGADELRPFTLGAETAFSYQSPDEDIERFGRLVEYDRTLAIFDAGAIVGTAAALSFELTLPGLTRIPVAGVTSVGVLPTHRRRGLLRAMMRAQLDDVRRRGEPLAVLTASESLIYGRFGYGLASSRTTLEIERDHAALAREWPASGRVRMVAAERALEVLEPLYDRLRRRQVGALRRSRAHWEVLLHAGARGTGPHFTAVYETPDGQVDGAVTYWVKREWAHSLPRNHLMVRECMAATPEVYAALWQFVAGVDLVESITLEGRPTDEPLRWMLADPRRLRVASLVDDLWVRIVDVPRALAARRYAVPGEVVLVVTDAFLPEVGGRYRLVAGPDTAACEPTDAAAELELTVADLGAAYLGGVRLATLARAGRVRELIPGALARADMLFATTVAPWCATSF